MRSVWIVLAAWVLVTQSSFARSQEFQAVPSLSELKEILNRQRGRITEMDVQVTLDGQEFVDEDTLFRLLTKKAVTRGTERFAFKGDKRFLDRTRTEPSKTFRQVGPADPAAIARVLKEPDAYERIARGELAGFEAVAGTKSITTKAAFDGTELRQLQGDMAFVINKNQSAKMYQFDALYPRALGFFVPDPSSTPETNHLNATSALPGNLDQFAYTVSRDELPEGSFLKLEGMTCLLMPENLHRRDVIRLDPLRGYMMVRRDIIEPASGQVEYRTTNSDPKEVLPGLWVPTKAATDEFAPATAPEKFRGSRLTRTDLAVNSISLAGVDEALFELSIRPGFLVADFKSSPGSNPYEIKPVIYQQPAGTKVFDDAAAAGNAHLRSSTLWLIAVNLLVLGVVGAIFLFFKFRG